MSSIEFRNAKFENGSPYSSSPSSPALGPSSPSSPNRPAWDDQKGHTVASASTMEPDFRSFAGTKTEKAKKIGGVIAERAKKAGVASVVFDRGGNRYAGRVAAIAEGARESGLEL